MPSPHTRHLLWPLLLTLAACSAVGPDYQAPRPALPDSWRAAHAGDPALLAAATGTQAVPAQWWKQFADPLLNELQQRAATASPDLKSAALRFAQARMQRQMVAAQRGPSVDARADVQRQRQSERGASARMISSLAPANSDELVKTLAEPFTLYEAGFDASWEIDFWGRVRRSVEAADAQVEQQRALLEQARLLVASEVARGYFELRRVQQQIAVTRDDLRATEEALALVQARADGGLVDDFDLVRQRSQLEDLRSRLPQLLAGETQAINQLGVLLGAQPGELQGLLAAPAGAPGALPDLSPGVPSEVARRRPDIRAAEAQLHAATANIGVAVAELYPSVRLGASFGYSSFESGQTSAWGSRQWAVGPSLSLPIFDNGRRRSQVTLRKLEQQEAAVAYQQTVLKAWQEVDDALAGYAAERQRNAQLQARLGSAGQAYDMAKARYAGGLTDFLVELDAQRNYLQARRDLVDSDGQLRLELVALYKAVGGGTPLEGGDKVQ
ncbi:efflux transporter outer membrane subunit [Pseudomonas aeruginosa]|uniref:efflux transporter outer membrane subunit n=2 Tax=Pseudomonadaceae TaxID=135621 RepID=UPI001A9CF781|nr:efflux transporter outer membrane subunit [Pseudomonas aeruginosa]MDE5050044.1 efflux transporter outer membrane subunit [Pseudomonas aeruginosa]QTB72000.1 efflux transporter outer membrane subunit [Pseudomonas aeruginosa]QTB84139.1 efflux transporter outer membrane subunit [Pseudomonas aeruginosa]HEJ2889908.1 efflux transporter outer membrane subunit [Pseudomonas aeruginosa]